MRNKLRFVFPLLFSIGGIGYTVYSLHLLTSAMPPFDWIYFIPGYLYNDVLFVMSVSLPFLSVEYFLIGIPFAAIYILGARIGKIGTHDLVVMKIGSKFGSMKLVKRSVAPALFAVSSSGYIIGLLEDYIFGTPPSIPPAVHFLYPLLLTLMGALILMPVALGLFMPTWFLNDAGIVTTLQREELEARKCPETKGVGDWYSDIIGGYSLLSFPLAMFHAHFLKPYILNPDPIPLTPFNIFISMLWTVGIPMLIMAFIIPVVIFHEFMRKRTIKTIQRIAYRLGAYHAELPKIKRVSAES